MSNETETISKASSMTLLPSGARIREGGLTAFLVHALVEGIDRETLIQRAIATFPEKRPASLEMTVNVQITQTSRTKGAYLEISLEDFANPVYRIVGWTTPTTDDDGKLQVTPGTAVRVYQDGTRTPVIQGRARNRGEYFEAFVEETVSPLVTGAVVPLESTEESVEVETVSEDLFPELFEVGSNPTIS